MTLPFRKGKLYTFSSVGSKLLVPDKEGFAEPRVAGQVMRQVLRFFVRCGKFDVFEIAQNGQNGQVKNI